MQQIPNEKHNLVVNILNEYSFWSKQYDTDKEKLGLLAEIVCRNVFGGILSSDKYDTEKDLILYDGTEVEVKVCIYFRKTNKFQINNNKSMTGTNKLENVDKLIFIERIRPNIIALYECINRDFESGLYNSDIVSDVSNFKLLYSIESNILYKIFSRLSTANENYFRTQNEAQNS